MSDEITTINNLLADLAAGRIVGSDIADVWNKMHPTNQQLVMKGIYQAIREYAKAHENGRGVDARNQMSMNFALHIEEMPIQYFPFI